MKETSYSSLFYIELEMFRNDIVVVFLLSLISISSLVLPRYKKITTKTVLFANNIRRSQTKRDKMYSKLLEQVDYNRVRSIAKTSLTEDPLIPMIEKIVKAADKRKAASVSAFRVYQLTEVTTFMVMIEGNSKPQNQAIALSIEEDIKEDFEGKSPISKEGSATSGWILLDYGSVIIHVMTPQMRNFYKIEKRWKDAEFLDVSHLVTPQDSTGSRTYDSALDLENLFEDGDDIGSGKGEEPIVQDKDEEDPFWK